MDLPWSPGRGSLGITMASAAAGEGEVGSQAAFPGTWLEAVVGIMQPLWKWNLPMLLTREAPTNALVSCRRNDLDRY